MVQKRAENCLFQFYLPKNKSAKNCHFSLRNTNVKTWKTDENKGREDGESI